MKFKLMSSEYILKEVFRLLKVLVAILQDLCQHQMHRRGNSQSFMDQKLHTKKVQDEIHLDIFAPIFSIFDTFVFVCIKLHT